MVRNWLLKIAYPRFDCENCLGIPEYGCYCISYNASAPGRPPRFRQKVAKKILEWVK